MQATYRRPPFSLFSLLRGRPQAIASLQGDTEYPKIYGTVKFYQTPQGVVVLAEVYGLPESALPCQHPIFGFHLHAGASCSGSEEDPFAHAMAHYNPQNCAHPYHAGDFPPLFGNNGTAISAFLTNRFTVREILGKTVIVHSQPDDFTTQPSGNSGPKIACGVVHA